MRLRQGQIAEHTRIVYQEAYDDGLQEGEKRGWEMGREAVAEWLENSGFMYERGTERHRVLLAGDVRKLKKP